MKSMMILIVFIIPINAYAEWSKVSEYQTTTFYVDTASIQKHDNKAQIQSLNTESSGKLSDYTSIKTLIEYDCNEHTSQILTLNHYNKAMAQGKPVPDSVVSLYPILPVNLNAKTIDVLEFELVCGQKS